MTDTLATATSGWDMVSFFGLLKPTIKKYISRIRRTCLAFLFTLCLDLVVAVNILLLA